MPRLRDAIAKAHDEPVTATQGDIQAIVIPIPFRAYFLIADQKGTLLKREKMEIEELAICLNEFGFPPSFEDWDTLEDG